MAMDWSQNIGEFLKAREKEMLEVLNNYTVVYAIRINISFNNFVTINACNIKPEARKLKHQVNIN